MEKLKSEGGGGLRGAGEVIGVPSLHLHGLGYTHKAQELHGAWAVGGGLDGPALALLERWGDRRRGQSGAWGDGDERESLSDKEG